MNTEPNIALRELEPAQMPSIYPLITQVNPELTRAQFDARLSDMLKNNYRCLGAWDGEALVGICGFWLFPRFWCGHQMDLDNFVIDSALRANGLGTRMMAWLEALAKEMDVDSIVLDSYSTSHDTHRFYMRHGYFIKGYHFIKPLKEGPLTGKAMPIISSTR